MKKLEEVVLLMEGWLSNKYYSTLKIIEATLI